MTRKTLCGIQADLDGRGRSADGRGRSAERPVVPGLWAAGEITGFGGGAVHGYRSLEGRFLGGCLFTGRQAGRDLAREV